MRSSVLLWVFPAPWAMMEATVVYEIVRLIDLDVKHAAYSIFMRHPACISTKVLWLIGECIGFVIGRLRVQLPACFMPGAYSSGHIVYTHVPLFTKQYNLVPAKGRWCSAAGKVTVGLASHWPCVTDSVVYPHSGSTATAGRWAPHLRSIGARLTLPYFYNTVS